MCIRDRTNDGTDQGDLAGTVKGRPDRPGDGVFDEDVADLGAALAAHLQLDVGEDEFAVLAAGERAFLRQHFELQAGEAGELDHCCLLYTSRRV